MLCSTPFGITEDRGAIDEPIDDLDRGAQRLSASLKFGTEVPKVECFPNAGCSTPFGITEDRGDKGPGHRTPANAVLNAFRHH